MVLLGVAVSGASLGMVGMCAAREELVLDPKSVGQRRPLEAKERGRRKVLTALGDREDGPISMVFERCKT